jgi:hypothetical protein
MITIPVSIGEVLDKISILQIKSERIADAQKLANVRKELAELQRVVKQHSFPELAAELKHTNQRLWDIEDRIRVKEKLAEFDDEFIELARAVYITNDRRAEIKRLVNEVSGSSLVEEKSYV